MRFVGIDPGKSGAIAVVSGDVVLVYPTPDFAAVAHAFEEIWGYEEEVYPVVAIEKVHAFPGQGVSSSFTFGKTYGSVCQAAVDSGYDILDVTPRVWQRVLGLPTREEAGGNTEKKNAHKDLASAIFPSIRVTHSVADALLIARWFEDSILLPND